MGRRNISEENSMSQMGHNLSPKTKGWTGNKRHQPIQQSIARKVVVEFDAAKFRIMG